MCGVGSDAGYGVTGLAAVVGVVVLGAVDGETVGGGVVAPVVTDTFPGVDVGVIVVFDG
jgi:hypothetical protein